MSGQEFKDRTYLIINPDFEQNPTMSIGGSQPNDGVMYSVTGLKSYEEKTYYKVFTLPYSTNTGALGVASP